MFQDICFAFYVSNVEVFVIDDQTEDVDQIRVELLPMRSPKRIRKPRQNPVTPCRSRFEKGSRKKRHPYVTPTRKSGRSGN